MSVAIDASRPGAGSLSDIRVIECGTLIAGPFCGQLLADFGAEVIKLEDPGAGDPMRQWGSQKVDGLSLSWPIIARNKKSVTCNLREPAGQDLARRLIRTADVLIENFRPGTLERWGLDYDSLSELNPGLILVRVTGYGQYGPYADRAGFGVIGEAMGGIRQLTGEPNQPSVRVGVSLGDSLAGTFATLGALAALHARKRTGRGQVVDAAIYESVLALMESLLPEQHIADFTRGRAGSVLPGVAPSNVYPTSDGTEVLIAANRDTVFTRLCAVTGMPDLVDDPRFADHHSRGANMKELDEIVASWTLGRTATDALEQLHAAGVPAGRTYTAKDMLADAHFAARESIVSMVHDRLGEFPMQNVAPKLSDTPGQIRWLGPELGQHNDEVYGELLGIDGAQRARLHGDGTI